MSVESKHDLSASELKAKKKEEKKRLKDAKKEKEVVQDVDDTVKEKSEKKSKKKSKKRSRDDGDEEKHDEQNERENNDTIEEDAGTEKRSRKKRKSVSFADKVDVQTIEHKDEKNGTGKDTNTEDHDDKINADNEEQSRERRKKEKREKREQRRKGSEKNATTPEGDKLTTESADKSIIAYLSQYYHDRASWKFQKIREAQLLKHVFSLEHVPSEYNPALLAYLKGLKSEGARTRLRKSAQDVIKFDEKQTSATSATDESATITEETKDIAKLPALPESWREEYGNAVYRYKANLNAGIKDLNEGVTLAAPDGDNDEDGEVDANVLTRLEHRKRAEMVLWTVSGKIGKYSSAINKQEKPAETESEPTETAASVTKKEKKQKAPARKKRKNRTMIVEISSSESSDSDSD
jgi:20S proteasome subunit alpha 1